MSDNLWTEPEPPVAGSELDTLLGTLERNRHTLAWKCADLDAAQMSVTIASSAITLGGLLRHLTRCERNQFEVRLFDAPPTGGDDAWAADWRFTPDDDVEQLWTNWRAAVAHSREQVARALADGGLDRAKGHEYPGYGTMSLRRLLTDTIEEYARHLGHADLIREAIDGRVGEDAPR